MALTVQKQPNTIVLSGNPAEFVVSSDTIIISNHKIHVQIYDTNSYGAINQLIGEESLPVINNSAEFDISDYLYKSTELNITIYDLFDKIPRPLSALNSYYVKIFETYNGDNTPRNLSTIGPLFSVDGGFSKIFLNNYLANGKNFYDDFLLDTKSFLTWSPVKKIGWNQHDFLFFITHSADYYYYKIIAYFKNSQTEEIDSEQALLNAYTLAWVNSSYLANQLDSIDTIDNVIDYYTVQVFNSQDEAVTEQKTYYIDRGTYPQNRQFIFKNSLGAYDIICLKGISEHVNGINRTVGYFQTKEAISFSEFIENYKAASGFLVTHYNDLSSAQRYITELFNSREIYEILGKEIIPVIPTGDKLKVKKDDEFLYSFVFEYSYAYTDEYFSPFDTEQYLNPRIFYRDGDIDDVAPGQTATVDFNVWMNQDATVTFTLNWGNDVGTTTIDDVSLVENVPKPLTSSIAIPGNVSGNRILVITDSQGGKYNIPYRVHDDVMLYNDGIEMLYNDETETEMLYN